MTFRRGHLDYFVAVAEEGQITRAAARLHVAQPALSQAMAQLESELGVMLLDRHSRGVTLTPAGEAFLPKARAAVAANSEAALTAEWLARAAQGNIEFGFVGHAPALDSPGLLAALQELPPGGQPALSRAPVPLLADEAVARPKSTSPCATARPRTPAPGCTPLREEPRVVLLPRTHPLAEPIELTVEDAVGQTFVGLDPSVDPDWGGFWSLDDYRGAPGRASPATTPRTPRRCSPRCLQRGDHDRAGVGRRDDPHATSAGSSRSR